MKVYSLYKNKMKKLLKFCITDFKKVNLYGDCMIEEWGYSYNLRGKRLDVKLFGLFWMTYKYYTI